MSSHSLGCGLAALRLSVVITCLDNRVLRTRWLANRLLNGLSLIPLVDALPLYDLSDAA